MRSRTMLVVFVVAAGCGAPAAPNAGSPPPAVPTGTEAAPARDPRLADVGPGEVGRYKCDCGDGRTTWCAVEGQRVVCKCGKGCHCDHGPLGTYRVEVTTAEPARAGAPATLCIVLRDLADGGVQPVALPVLLVARDAGGGRQVLELVEQAIPETDGTFRVPVTFPEAATYVVEVSLAWPAGGGEATVAVPLEVGPAPAGEDR